MTRRLVSLNPATAARLGMDTSDGRPSYPMSGRQGIGIKIRDLLDLMEASIDRERSRKAGLSNRAIAAGAIRYFPLRYNLGTEIVFDMDSALDVHGNTGPYRMYAHARADGIPDAHDHLRLRAGAALHRLLRKHADVPRA